MNPKNAKFFACSRIGLLVIFLSSLTAGLAQITSKSNGNWNNPNTWDCTCIPGVGDVVTVEHSITSASSVSVLELRFSTEWSPNQGHGRLNIISGTFSVAQGTVSFGNNGQSTHSLTIASGAVFDAASADIQWLQGAGVTVNGTLYANNFNVANGNGGNFSVGSSGNVVFGGTIGITSGPHTFNIDGDFQTGGITISGNNSINITGNGNVNVSGNVSATSSGIINVDAGNMNVSGNIHTSGDSNINTTNGGTVNAGSCSGYCDSDADINVSLPVTLLNFQVKSNEQHVVQLEWQTASEVNNDYFTLEKSYDGITFSTVAKVNGAGDSKTLRSYTYRDAFLSNNDLTYYRLSQTDFDGTHVMLKVVSVGSATGQDRVQLAPNVLFGNTVVKAEGARADMSWKVISLSGHVLRCGSFIGGNQLRLDDLGQGVYLFEVTSPNSRSTQRFVVK